MKTQIPRDTDRFLIVGPHDGGSVRIMRLRDGRFATVKADWLQKDPNGGTAMIPVSRAKALWLRGFEWSNKKAEVENDD